MLMNFFSLGYDRGWSCLDRYMNRRALFQELQNIRVVYCILYFPSSTTFSD